MTFFTRVSADATLLWFRQDLRLQDNRALQAALARRRPIVPVFIFDPAADSRWTGGAASRWWLHHSLQALAASLARRGSRLVLASGDARKILPQLARETGATALYWNRCYEPARAALDREIGAWAATQRVEARAFGGALLHEPAVIANKQGRPFQVFTPFWRRCLECAVEPPVKLAAAVKMPVPEVWPRSVELSSLGLLPRPDWAREFSAEWKPGEEGARDRLRAFVTSTMAQYAATRDLPAIDGTSRLSPHLHFGEITPAQIWAAVRWAAGESGVFPPNKGAATFLRELGWREFAYHLLAHFPQTTEQPLRPEFARFPWADDPGGAHAEAWRRGRTGYPIVDAGMRQLWRTGWMHNRVRMIVGSFFVKHLRLPWTLGAAWFWDTLVDADMANNTLGWQWIAGSGADAAPFFRIFAPVTQGEKFDPEGDYIRRWVPELARLPVRFIHAPWQAPADVLAAAGVRLGESYPQPIVDHVTARKAALAAFQEMRDAARP